eukprot:TRINITY_DN36616_c0_g2_i2.p1 TRINITY_DN36616_c0_g2~~TRINITY_DN36616_c0_g2_i2.p1  ORF type:complete len:141 (+),score=18.50 TRINITY_DN36616_c0_g2_i2:172-594(+)
MEALPTGGRLRDDSFDVELDNDGLGLAPKRPRHLARDPGLAALQQGAYFRHISGDADGARSLYEEALRRCPEDESRVLAEVRSELGSACAAMGDRPSAILHSEIACRLFRQVLAEDHPTLQRLIGRIYCLNLAAAASCAM